MQFLVLRKFKILFTGHDFKIYAYMRCISAVGVQCALIALFVEEKLKKSLEFVNIISTC